MIKAKTHKAKSDKEKIIDMEPVNETQKTIILKNPIFLIPFITVFSFIIILIWLTVYYLPNHIEQLSNKIIQQNNEIEALKDKENINYRDYLDINRFGYSYKENIKKSKVKYSWLSFIKELQKL